MESSQLWPHNVRMIEAREHGLSRLMSWSDTMDVENVWGVWWTNSFICMYMYVYVYSYVYIYIYICIYIYTHIFLHLSIYLLCVYCYVHMYIYIYIQLMFIQKHWNWYFHDTIMWDIGFEWPKPPKQSTTSEVPTHSPKKLASFRLASSLSTLASPRNGCRKIGAP